MYRVAYGDPRNNALLLWEDNDLEVLNPDSNGTPSMWQLLWELTPLIVRLLHTGIFSQL